MVHYPEIGDQQSIRIEATESRKTANRKVVISDRWRFAGLLLFWLSLLAFIAGCLLGTFAVLDEEPPGVAPQTIEPKLPEKLR